jgi:hypothetical protein
MLLHLIIDLAAGPSLLSPHITKLNWVGLYHQYFRNKEYLLTHFSSTIIILLMLPLDVISFYFFYVFSVVLMLFDTLLL